MFSTQVLCFAIKGSRTQSGDIAEPKPGTVAFKASNNNSNPRTPSKLTSSEEGDIPISWAELRDWKWEINWLLTEQTQVMKPGDQDWRTEARSKRR